MKKVLLSAALFAATYASAQITKTATSFKIDFSNLTTEQESGVTPSPGWSPNCEEGDGNAVANQSYSSALKDGAVEIYTTGKQSDYHKMRIPVLDETGFPSSVDLSNVKDRGIEIELESSVAGIEFLAILAGGSGTGECASGRGDQVVADDVPAIKTQVTNTESNVWSNRNDALSLNDESEGGFKFKVFENFTLKKAGCHPKEGQFIDSTNINEVWVYFRVAPAYEFVIDGNDTTAQIETNNGCDNGVGKSIEGTFKIKSIYLGELAPEPLAATVTHDAGGVTYDIDFAGKTGPAYTLVSNSRFTTCTDNPTIKAQQVNNGALEFMTSGDQEQYHHAEMKIVDANGQPTTIDLSNEDNQFIQFDVESDVAVEEFMILFADDNTKNCIRTVDQVAADNNPAIKGALNVGANTINNDNDIINGNDYGLGGFDWKVFQTPCMKEQSCGAGQYVDSTKISEVWIYARKPVVESAVCVQNEQTENCGKSIAANIRIKKMTIGDKRLIIGLEEFSTTEATFSVFPNPVSEGVINFSEELEVVELYNTQGNLVKTGVNTDKLVVEGLEAGIYVVQSNKGYKRVVIK